MPPLHPSRTLSFLFLCSLPLTTLAAVDYQVSGILKRGTITLGSYDHDAPVQTGDETRFDSADPGDPAFHVQASSLAGPAGLHAHAFSQIIKNFTSNETSNYSQVASSFAQGTWDDFIITGPAGSGPITVSLNVHLDGGFATQASAVPSGFSVASSNVQVIFFANDNNLGGGSQTDATNNGVHQPLQSTGSLASFTGNNTITSPTFTAPVNTPFSIALQLSLSAGIVVQYGNAVEAAATCDFENTLTFATGGPVFNLPNGYTASSPQAGIIDNTYLVPEPTGLTLGAITVLPLLRRRRPHRPH